jgi:hypothetical protein
MSNLSYYDEIDEFIRNPKQEKKNLTEISSIFKFNNNNQFNLIKQIRQVKYSPKYLLQRLEEDMPKLEKFIIDNKYRDKLQNAYYHSEDHYEFLNIYGLEKRVKEKIGIPENATIKYEKVKCSKKCKHDHQYFYAYYWDSNTKKLKKKYIGRELPEPFKFKITYSKEEIT